MVAGNLSGVRYEDFARKWNFENCVQLSGSTGAAAAAIVGRTVHSVVEYGRKKRRRIDDNFTTSISRGEVFLDQRETFPN